MDRVRTGGQHGKPEVRKVAPQQFRLWPRICPVTIAPKHKRWRIDLCQMRRCAAIQELIYTQNTCSAILCFSDVLALGALFELQRHRIAVPEKMSLIGIDDLPSSSCTFPEITAIHLPVARMDEATAQSAVHWLDNQVVPVWKLLLAELIVRHSTMKLT